MRWRRWVGGIVGAAIAFAAGATGGGKLYAWMEKVDLASEGPPRASLALGLGVVAALVGGFVGYERGRRADAQRARRQSR